MKRLIPLAILLSLTNPALAQRISDVPLIRQQKAVTQQKTTPRPRPAAPTAAPAPAATEVGTGIIAVVNDSVITSTDLMQRLRLAIVASGLPDSPEVHQHLLPQILRSLIDETLQVQEAKRLDLSVSKEEVDQALARIAHENNIPGDMRSFVAARGASGDALAKQIKNGMLWSKVVQHALRPRVEVGDDEVDAVIERMRANAGKEEFLMSEIFLTVDTPKDEEQVRQMAQNLADELRHGANFTAVARQFSQGASAAQGGDIGWMQQSQLAPEINRALAQAKPGQVSDPIRTANGFHIMGVRDRRTVSLGDPDKASVNLMQAFRPFDANTAMPALQQDAARLRSSVKDCGTLNQTITASFPGWKVQKLGDMVLNKAPKGLAEKIAGVPVGGSSQPLATDKGAAILFVCARNDGGDIDREAIMRSIGTEKLELQARRLQRDMRRSAYIDIRVK